MLDDGSTLLATESAVGRLPTTLLQDLPLDSLPITAIWSESGELTPLPPDTKLEAEQIATIATTVPTFLTKPVLTPNQFTASEDDAIIEYSYNRLPSVWLKNLDHEARAKATGFIRINTGERLVLGKDSTFQLQSYSPQTVTLTQGSKTLLIPLDTISTLRLPKE